MLILDRFSLKNKVAVLTGGAGGYGRQIAKALAEAGAQTYMASRNINSLEQCAEEYRKSGYDVTALQFDQGDEKTILELRDKIMKQAGRIDVLVNNAVARPMSDFHDSASAFAESMKINATGLFLISRTLGDVMAQAGGGSIINIGSIHGMTGPHAARYRGTKVSGWWVDYFFHKGGMVNFTRFVASYYGRWGMRCNCVSPGGLYADGMEPIFVQQYNDRTFLGRLASETDLMGIIVFLASDASLYITGTNIPVNGGYTAM